MLIESAIGDSYGGGFEYVSNEIVAKFNNALEYRQHPNHTKITPGKYTDDTQMALAIAEAIFDNDPWETESLAQRFVDVFKRDERTGYSSRLYHILKTVNNGSEFLQSIKADSDRSGAAMRAPPIGLFKNTKEVIERAKIQAIVTHNSPLGISAAVASALMTHFFARGLGNKSDLGFFLEFYAEDNLAWDRPYKGQVGEKGWMSVMAAVTAIKETHSMADLLKKCVAFTGDVDTVAAIALAAASFSSEVEQNIPQNLYDNLENGTYGREYIEALDNQLLDKFGIKRPKKPVSDLLKKFDALTVKTRKS